MCGVNKGEDKGVVGFHLHFCGYLFFPFLNVNHFKLFKASFFYSNKVRFDLNQSLENVIQNETPPPKKIKKS